MAKAGERASTRSASVEIPVLEEMVEKKTSARSRQVALAAVFAALYAISVTVLAPISFNVYQVRVADMLLPLSILFGPPAIVGLTLGTLVGNLSSPFGAVDIVGGAIANLVATFLAWQIGKRKFRGAWFAGTTAEVLAITLIVGTYLSFLLQISVWLSLTGVLVGEIVAVSVAGYLLLTGVSKALGQRLLQQDGAKDATPRQQPARPPVSSFDS